MTSIESVALEVPDLGLAKDFYGAAFDLGARVGLRASEAPTTGFRGFTLSLVVSQPSTVDELIGGALDAGATPLTSVRKSFWGYGGVIQAPDGTIWKIATSSKKNSGPATGKIDEVVLLLGVEDVAASKRFYLDRGLTVAKSFGRRYVEFATQHVRLALYGRRALAKGRRRLPGRHRVAPARHLRRRRAFHRPRRLRVGGGGSPRRASGACDCGVHAPAGKVIRIQERR